jgi:deoxyribose-phosphate aldolase
VRTVSAHFTRQDVAATIEATALAPGTSAVDVGHLCAAGLVHGVRAVCVPLEHVPVAVSEVAGSGVIVVTVAGFPGGDDPTKEKVVAIDVAAETGADEVDVVLDHRAIAAGRIDDAAADIRSVVESAHASELAVKIILETGALTVSQVEEACRICVGAGADWVKTSTGFGPRGASVDDVRRMRSIVGDRARVKAAGGIRTWQDAVALLDAGADAIGCSAFVEILERAPH